MIGITLRDKVRNEELRRRTGLKDVVTEAKHLKWKWAGHVIRRSDNRWSHKTTLWIPREGGETNFQRTGECGDGS